MLRVVVILARILVAGGAKYVQHRRVDGTWLRTCNVSTGLWRGVALRDLRHARQAHHDLVSSVPRLGLVALEVPKVASSSCRNYTKLLDGVTDVSWGSAAPNATTFALTRDPLERFVSASGTLWHRRAGDAWDTKGIKLIKGCVGAGREFERDKGVGKYSYASAANLARCILAKTEEAGVFWNHHIAPQLSYYVVLNPNTKLVHGAFDKHSKIRWTCDPAPRATARPAACVHMPTPVHAMPMRDARNGASLVQRAFDRAIKIAGIANASFNLPRMPTAANNLQEGRWKLLNYTVLLEKLGPGFAQRICKLYRDDYVCLELPAPLVCRDLPGFEDHASFYGASLAVPASSPRVQAATHADGSNRRSQITTKTPPATEVQEVLDLMTPLHHHLDDASAAAASSSSVGVVVKRKRRRPPFL